MTRSRNPARRPPPPPTFTGPDHRAADALLARLQPSIVRAAREWPEVAAFAGGCVVVAGTRAGVLRIGPDWTGTRTYAVIASPRRDVVAALRTLEETELAGALELPTAPDHIDVLLVTDTWAAVSVLAPDTTTAPGGSA